MLRRAWQSADESIGWVQVLRCRRLRSEKWFSAKGRCCALQSEWAGASPSRRKFFFRRFGRDEHTREVSGGSVADWQSEGYSSLSNRGFILAQRTSHALSRAEAVISRAVEQTAICEEVAEGEKRVQQFFLEDASSLPLALACSPKSRSCSDTETSWWRSDETQPGNREFGARTDPSIKEIPPIPVSVQELGGWISERNCDLRNALEFGDFTTVAHIGSLLSQDVSQLASVPRNIPVEGQSQTSMMETLTRRLGRESVQPWSVPGTSEISWHKDAANDVLVSLEHELTLFDVVWRTNGQTHRQPQCGAESREREFSRSFVACVFAQSLSTVATAPLHLVHLFWSVPLTRMFVTHTVDCGDLVRRQIVIGLTRQRW